MKQVALTIALANIVAVGQVQAGSSAKAPQSFGYFLPRTEVKAVTSQRIVACPDPFDPEKELGVATEVTLAPESVPDVYISIDLRSGWLAERTTSLTLNPDGTIASFNAKTEGQGGKVIGSLFKVAATAVGLGTGSSFGGIAAGRDGMKMSFRRANTRMEVETKSVVRCSDDVQASIEKLAAARASLSQMSARIVADGGSAIDLAILERLKEQIGAAREALTLTSEERFVPKKPPAGSPPNDEFHLPPVAFEKWFVVEQVQRTGSGPWEPVQGVKPSPAARSDVEALLSKQVGRAGFWISLKPNDSQWSAFAKGNPGVSYTGAATPYLYYRRPVDTEFTAQACATIPEKGAPCNLDESDEAKSAESTESVPVAQFSNLHMVRIGKGGIFGSKQASAKFDEFGTPAELEYGSASGAGDIADVIDAGNEAVGTIRDAKVDAIKRRIELEKAQKELADLMGSADE